MESLPTARLLLLVNYRPEYSHGWGSKTYYRQLQIDPLPPESAEALLDALLGSDATLAPLKRLVIERTEGNPFFIEESVRSLVETGVLAGERGAYRLTRVVHGLQVPATAQAMLAARIDRLDSGGQTPAPGGRGHRHRRPLRAASGRGRRSPRSGCAGGWPSSRRPSSSTRRGCSRISSTPSATRSPTRSRTAACSQERRRALHARIVEAIEAPVW